MRCTVNFDISSIPTRSTVSAAKLSLYVIDVTMAGLASAPLSLYSLTQGWDENTACWRYRSAGTSWGAAGASYSTGVVASAQFSSLSKGAWVTFALPPDLVQGWIANGASNFGLLIKREPDSDPGTGDYRNNARFASSEYATASLRPKLEITYSAGGNVKPMATLASPTNGSVLIPHQDQAIAATASDPDGSVARVEFYANGRLLGQDTNAPFTLTWPAMLAGTYGLEARAYDDAGACTASKTSTVRVLSTVYSAMMDTNPGWTLGTDWVYGKPQGYDSYHDDGDPTTGWTGNNVIGYRFTSTIGAMTNTAYARTPAINCSSYSNVVLSFHYWLGMGFSYYWRAGVEVSNNGSTWQSVWQNPYEAMTVGAWRQMSLNISSVADKQPTVYVRWSMGPFDYTYYYSGWNLDDVMVLGSPPPPVIADGDGDSMTDAWEARYFGSATNCNRNADPDKDGLSNGEEFLAGTCPTNAGDLLCLRLTSEGSNAVLSFPTAAANPVYSTRSRYYDLQFATNLIVGRWTNVVACTNIPGDNRVVCWTNAPPTNLFYRVRARLQ